MTGAPLQVKHYGKPHPEPYRLAEQLLLRQAQRLGFAASAPAAAIGEAETAAGTAASSSATSSTAAAAPRLPFSAIYAIGDNPAADVRGANAAGAPWVSVLVTQTGVATRDSPHDPAQVVVPDVEAAVDAALHRARAAKWHSMR